MSKDTIFNVFTNGFVVTLQHTPISLDISSTGLTRNSHLQTNNQPYEYCYIFCAQLSKTTLLCENLQECKSESRSDDLTHSYTPVLPDLSSCLWKPITRKIRHHCILHTDVGFHFLFQGHRHKTPSLLWLFLEIWT